jgi:transposase
LVPVKSAQQQAVLALHRVRQGFIEERTAIVNRIRGLLTEFGIALPNTTVYVRREAAAASEGLPHFARLALAEPREHLHGSMSASVAMTASSRLRRG